MLHTWQADTESQRGRPKDFSSGCRKCPKGGKKGLPCKSGPMVRQSVKSGRWCRVPGLRRRQGHRAACSGPIGSGQPRPAVQQSWPAQRVWFNECHPARRSGQAGIVSRENGMGDCVRTSRPQTPIWFNPPPPRGDNARASLRRKAGAKNPQNNIIQIV